MFSTMFVVLAIYGLNTMTMLRFAPAVINDWSFWYVTFGVGVGFAGFTWAQFTEKSSLRIYIIHFLAFFGFVKQVNYLIPDDEALAFVVWVSFVFTITLLVCVNHRAAIRAIAEERYKSIATRFSKAIEMFVPRVTSYSTKTILGIAMLFGEQSKVIKTPADKKTLKELIGHLNETMNMAEAEGLLTDYYIVDKARRFMLEFSDNRIAHAEETLKQIEAMI